jgi:D-arabinose 1-dehydrogenase-like Zn-dependent alcohol dehydrogenase
MSGDQHLCLQAQPTIIGHRGGFASHVRSHWAWALPLPEQINFAEAGPLLCGGVTVFNPLVMYAKPTSRVGIVGIGGLGHMGVKFARALGANVVVFTTSPNKKDDALHLGADEVVISRDADEMQKHASSFDFILDAVSADHDINAYINLLRRDGNITVVGAPENPLAVSAFGLLMGRRSLSGSLSAVSPKPRRCSTSAGSITSPPTSKSSRSRKSTKLTRDCSSPM